MKKRKYLVLFLLPLLMLCFLSVGYSSAETLGKIDVGASFVYFDPFWGTNFTLSEVATPISLHVYTHLAGSDVVIGLYNQTASGLPDKLLFQTGNITSVLNGWVYGNVTATNLESGVYWLLLGGSAGSGLFAYDEVNPSAYQAVANWVFPSTFAGSLSGNYNPSCYLYYTPYIEPTPTPTPFVSATPFPEGTMDDTDWWISILVVMLIIINIFLMMLPFALVRFTFGILSLFLCMLALSYQVPLSPYLQTAGLLISALAMLFSVRARE